MENGGEEEVGGEGGRRFLRAGGGEEETVTPTNPPSPARDSLARLSSSYEGLQLLSEREVLPPLTRLEAFYRSHHLFLINSYVCPSPYIPSPPLMVPAAPEKGHTASVADTGGGDVAEEGGRVVLDFELFALHRFPTRRFSKRRRGERRRGGG